MNRVEKRTNSNERVKAGVHLNVLEEHIHTQWVLSAADGNGALGDMNPLVIVEGCGVSCDPFRKLQQKILHQHASELGFATHQHAVRIYHNHVVLLQKQRVPY